MEEKSLLFYITKVIRLALYPVTLIYGLLVWVRNRLYDVKFFNSITFSIPVICVGNLSTGGTGKTPHIEYLLQLLQYRYRVATMSRGYKRFTKGFILAGPDANALKIGDEPMQYVLKFPEAAVSVAEDRLTGIPNLLHRRPDVEVVLLDDAYQHRSVKAGLTILVSDYSKPFYNDHILPFGNLREGRGAYSRADVIIISKCPPGLQKKDAEQVIQKVNPLQHQKVFFTTITYEQPYDLFTREPLQLNNGSALLVCGIARPEPLVSFLKQQALDVHTLTYNDHHYYVTTDLEEIKTAFANWSAPEKVIVTTEKDATRLLLHADKLRAWDITIAVVPIKMDVLFQEGPLLDELVIAYVDTTIAKLYPTEDYPPIPDAEPDTAPGEETPAE